MVRSKVERIRTSWNDDVKRVVRSGISQCSPNPYYQSRYFISTSGKVHCFDYYDSDCFVTSRIERLRQPPRRLSNLHVFPFLFPCSNPHSLLFTLKWLNSNAAHLLQDPVGLLEELPLVEVQQILLDAVEHEEVVHRVP